MNFAIDRAYQNMGLGSWLMRTILFHARIKRATRIVLDVDCRNFPAQDFYQKHGFSFATKGQCDRPGSLVMSKELEKFF